MQLRVVFTELAPEQDTGRPPFSTLGEILDMLAKERKRRSAPTF